MCNQFTVLGPQVIAEYDNIVLKRRFIYGPGIDEPVMMKNRDSYLLN